MRIEVQTIPAAEQRYLTIGDYWYDDKGVLQVRVTETGNKLYDKLIAIHELIEQTLTEERGLSELEITDYDLAFESARKAEDDEPGFGEGCPYTNEHAIATAVEMMMCAQAGVAWRDYENHLNGINERG